MTREALGLVLILSVLGAGWGSTQPLSKIAVSGGHQPLGLVFWQLVIAAVILGLVTHLRGRSLPLGSAQIRLYIVIALVGTVLPNSASYAAVRHLPAGLMSILLSLVPMFALPIALALGIDRFSLARLAGLCCGLAGVLMIVGPEASLPERAMVAFIPLALIAPFFYALEGNIVAKWGTAGVGPIRLLYGASLAGIVISLPLALATGQFIDPRPPWGAPELALVLSSVVHAIVYSVYVWLVGRAGAVFAAQVAYLVTGFGVVWAMVLLGERYSGWVWAALLMMLAGLFLVQPRRADPVAPEPRPREDGV